MPRHSDAILKNIVTCLGPVAECLSDLDAAYGSPFAKAMSSTVASLVTSVQNVKRNRDECVQLLENIHVLLYSIVNLHMAAGGGDTIPPATLYHLGKFTETLHKIYIFVEEQQEGNRIKQFFRQSEMNTLLKDCRLGLQQAAEVFKTDHNLTTLSNITEFQALLEKMHQELLESISTLSDPTSLDRDSSIYHRFMGSNSSNSLSMLPAKPKIFHGRDSELSDIIQLLRQESARIAILGAGGIGKTSLAHAVLHHPDIVVKYETSVFVVCDSATNSIELASLIGSHIGMKSGQDLTASVVQYFSSTPSCLLILDNLETAWEPLDTRGGVEEFLSLLTDSIHLALIITMRGAERPAKVRWTRPFSKPLGPLSQNAARQVFIDIADESHDSDDIDALLNLTDNMPLAIDLLAHLVDYQGCDIILARWETEKTFLLSDGYDRKSSLHASIATSLSSPRLQSLPGAQELLSLLSILPDGLSDIELLQSGLPIQNLLGCKAILLQTALAYNDNNNRLKSLGPIREHIRHFSPPSAPVIFPLLKHFHILLELYAEYSGSQLGGVFNEIHANYGNLQQVLLLGLHRDNPHLAETIKCTIALSSFSRMTGHSRVALLDHIRTVFPRPVDHSLEVQFIIEVFCTHIFNPISAPDLLIDQGIDHFRNVHDPALESKFYRTAGNHYCDALNELPKAIQFLEKALSLAESCGDTNQQCTILDCVAQVKWRSGDYVAARMNAREAQRLAKLSANLYQEAKTLWTEAICCRDLGDYEDSIILCHRAWNLLKLCGISGGYLHNNIMTNEAGVHLQKTEYAAARRIHEQILHGTSANQDPDNYALALLSVAQIDVMIGVPEKDVLENLDKSRTIFSNSDFPVGVTCCESILADLYLRDGRAQVAKEKFLQCLHSSWGKSAEVVAFCLEKLANISRWPINDIGFMSMWPAVYLGYARKTQQRLTLYMALQFLGDMFLLQGDTCTAHSLLTIALEGLTQMDIHHNRAQCMLHLGDIAAERADSVNALELWEHARPLFERTLQLNDIAAIDERLFAQNKH